MKINPHVILDEKEITFSFIRAPGPGGQNVNKVATAVLLRLNIKHSPSLPETVRTRMIAALGNKLTHQGDLLIKANSHRTQERNRQDAMERLQHILQRAAFLPKKRKKTKPTKSSIEKRIQVKKLIGKKKQNRGSHAAGRY